MKSEKGSSIVMAVVVGMVLTILLGACFAIASSYHNRSIMNHQERQAYLTAKSIVDTISVQITAGNDNFIPKESEPTIEFNDIQLTGDTCEEKKATITLNNTDNVIVIVASATNYKQTQEIQLTMTKDSTTGQWQNLQYSHKGETVYEKE
ncbi:hypothetical protein [Candidatus Stoquefichus sp. SB1]|uniref:hypothetical protein n=1 Tax=Candidatus Stoquefichus sp. SB1 TaxID=1658109 RepID=UPI00067F7029|nr:hypothetical protein [Candidatus Stoquefichus sp. SB1]